MKKIVDYTPDIISRNVKKVRNGLIEIKRYSDSGIRYLAWSWFLIVLGYWVHNIINKDVIYDDIQWAISVDSSLKPQYDRLKERRINAGREYPTYEKYKEGMIELHGSSFYSGIFFIVFPIFLFFCVVSPKWRPLRIDTERRLVYFWLWGQFYIIRYPKNGCPLNVLHPRMHRPSLRWETHGALVLRIPHESKAGKWTEVDLGIHWPACENQNYVLQNFLNDYLSSSNPAEFERYFHKEKTLWSDYANRFFYRFSLFPDRGYNEKKTEAKIQAWLANNPEVITQENEAFLSFFSNFPKN